MPAKRTEADLGAKIVAHLEADGYEVYQEVLHHGAVADIVAVRAGICVAIECKLSLTLTLLGQAHHWLHRAHEVWIAIPAQRRPNKGFYFAKNILGMLGIGLMTVTRAGDIRESLPAKLFRPKPKALIEVRPEQKVFSKAGSNRGGHWTPFKETCGNLLHIVKATPGIPVKEALDKLTHHYSSKASARACLVKLIGQKVVPGLEVRHENGSLRFFTVYRE